MTRRQHQRRNPDGNWLSFIQVLAWIALGIFACFAIKWTIEQHELEANCIGVGLLYAGIITGTSIALSGSDPNTPALIPLTFTITLSPSHGTLTGAAPNLTYTPVNGVGGADSFQFTVTNTANLTSTAAIVSLTVTANPPPVFTSAPTAAPNPAAAGQPVHFTASATSALTLTYAWAFGDGTTGSGPSVAHTYALIGNYMATVTVTDTATGSASGTVGVTVLSAALVGFGPDTDGDGFSDSVEIVAGTNVADGLSTPIGQPIIAANIGPLTLSTAQIKLNFAKPAKDSISFSGSLSDPANFNPSQAAVVLDAGGVTKRFPLGAKGSSKIADDSFKLSLKVKKGVVQANPAAKFSVKFNKGSFSNTLASTSGLTNDDLKAVPRTVIFTLVFNNTVLQKQQNMIYRAKKGKTGMAK